MNDVAADDLPHANAVSPSRTAPAVGMIDILLLTVVATWGVNFRAAQYAGRLVDGGRLDPRAIILLRMALVVPAIIPLTARLTGRSHRQILTLSKRDLVLAAALALAAIPGNQLLFIWGMQHTSTIHGSLLFALSPALASALAHVTGREQLRGRVWLGITIAFVGVSLVVSRSAALAHGARTDAEPSLLGDLLIIGSAACWGIYTTFSTLLLDRRGGLEVTALTMIFGLAWSALLFGPVLAAEVRSGAFWRIDPRGWLGLLYISYMGALYGWAIWARAVAKIGPSRTMLYQYLVPIVVMVLGLTLFGERLEIKALVGAALILTGVWLGRRG